MSNAVEIIPAVLPQSWRELEEKLERVHSFAKLVQIDVVDGEYARAKTWPYRDGASFEKVVEEEHGLPHWDTLDFEFDLMVFDPAAVVNQYVLAGASRIVLHAKSSTAVKALTDLANMREEGGSFTVQVGLALGAHQSPDDLEPFEAQFDFVQVMGIEREGKQGEPPSAQGRYLVERLRSRYPNLPIQVDGGVNMETARALAQAGATRLIAGSAILNAEDPKAAFDALVKEANN